MITFILDIESIPSPGLENRLPAELANPVMPDEIANPEEPDFASKCPKYGGDEIKQRAWIEDKKGKWITGVEAARGKWRVAQIDARARYVETAALHADRGCAKLVGVQKHCGGFEPLETVVFAWEPNAEVTKRLRGYAMDAGFAFHCSMLEKQMLSAVFHYLGFSERSVDPAKELRAIEGAKSLGMISGEDYAQQREEIVAGISRIITFYGNTFDLPFLARRGAILGNPEAFKFLRGHRRGSRLNSDKFVDLCDEWKLGDRDESTGGLEGLVTTLGYAGAKLGDGKSFSAWFKESPEEGVQYLLNDLHATAYCARAIGLL